MGRPTKSEAAHQLNGTVSQAKAIGQSHIPGGRPRFPSDVPKEARREFKKLCGLLEERRALTKGDYHLLRLYVIAWDRHKRNYADLLEEGEVCEYTRLDNNGQAHKQVKKNVRFDIVERAEKEMLALLVALGLTPTAKDRAKPVGQPELKPELIEGTVAHYRSIQVAHISAPVPVSPTEMIEEEQDA